MQLRILRDRLCKERHYLMWIDHAGGTQWVIHGTAGRGTAGTYRRETTGDPRANHRRAQISLSELLEGRRLVISDGGPCESSDPLPHDHVLEVTQWKQSVSHLAQFRLLHGTSSHQVPTPALVQFGCDLPGHPDAEPEHVWAIDYDAHRQLYAARRMIWRWTGEKHLKQLLQDAGRGARDTLTATGEDDPGTVARVLLTALDAHTRVYPAGYVRELFAYFAAELTGHANVTQDVTPQGPAEYGPEQCGPEGYRPARRRIDLE